jgi:hypothetical protein
MAGRAAASANRGRHHRHRLPGPAGGGLRRRQPVIHRSRRLIECGTITKCGRVTELPLLAFSHCMRSHGVPNFPDPQPGASNAKFPGAQQLGVGSSQLRAAENACWHVLPPGTDDQFPPAEVPLLLRGMLPFARCMRSHGVPNFPDPAVDSEGRPIFPLSTHGISLNYSHSRQFTTKMDDCQHMLPHQLGGIPFG